MSQGLIIGHPVLQHIKYDYILQTAPRTARVEIHGAVAAGPQTRAAIGDRMGSVVLGHLVYCYPIH